MFYGLEVYLKNKSICKYMPTTQEDLGLSRSEFSLEQLMQRYSNLHTWSTAVARDAVLNWDQVITGQCGATMSVSPFVQPLELQLYTSCKDVFSADERTQGGILSRPWTNRKVTSYVRCSPPEKYVHHLNLLQYLWPVG